MKRTIKQEVMIRVAITFIAVIISGWMTVSSMGNISSYTKSTEEANNIHALVLTAQVHIIVGWRTYVLPLLWEQSLQEAKTIRPVYLANGSMIRIYLHLIPRC